MSIKVVTFHFANNYGAVLQAYALQTYLERYGHVDFLNYEPEHLKKLYSLNPLSSGFHPREIVRKTLTIPYRKKQSDLFSKFRREQLKCTIDDVSSRETVSRTLNTADVVVYGSDQIWNLNITHNDSVYFGDLVKKNVRKVAYAASFGADNDHEIICQYIDTYLKTFDAISVREASGTNSLKENGIHSCELVCDPVFLLDKNKWGELASKPTEKIEQRFILYYALRKDENLIQSTQKIGHDYGIPVYSIHPNGDKSFMLENQLHKVGPREFLWLIKNAEFICTNSFHAVAFSSIFQKKVLFYGYENGKGRVESLLDILNAHKSIDNEKSRNEYFDLSEADFGHLDVLRNQSMNFLEKNILQNAGVELHCGGSKKN